MATKKETRETARSAITGQYVPMWQAKIDPDHTVVEKIKKK